MTYALPGECVDNACQFVETTSNCEEGFICSGGLCLDASDPCAGIVCNTPPESTCTSPTRGIVYGETGVCVEGECVYETTVNQCEDGEGCADGVCETCNVSYPNWLGDGYCDSSSYNTAACGWDGAIAALQHVRARAAQRPKQAASTRSLGRTRLIQVNFILTAKELSVGSAMATVTEPPMSRAVAGMEAIAAPQATLHVLIVPATPARASTQMPRMRRIRATQPTQKTQRLQLRSL